MLQAVGVPAQGITCLVCGRLAEQTICLRCEVRIQGQAIESKRQEEKRGTAGIARC